MGDLEEHLATCPHETEWQAAEAHKLIEGKARGISLLVGNTHQAMPDGLHHQWTVFVKAADGSDLEAVEQVTFLLHPSPDGWVVCTRAPFAVAQQSWGTFSVKIEVLLRNKQVARFEHYLDFGCPLTQDSHYIQFAVSP
eukprot:NODE_425_length_1390_cov_103.030574_g311_i0.p2 GENE.NODE_425_length_1390_cov_103.030574_g311_i0~~NODE_425_length_1390_cov_103.030574_g311_i0.p2  ORF type:complete len:146 (+),score=62.25 NODE_425_length_1390_cov_103.030574_g311_i0:22-438(+)